MAGIPSLLCDRSANRNCSVRLCVRACCTVPSSPIFRESSGSCFHCATADVPTKLCLIVSRGARIVLIRPRAPTSERGTVIGTPWRILSARYQRLLGYLMRRRGLTHTLFRSDSSLRGYRVRLCRVPPRHSIWSNPSNCSISECVMLVF